MNRRGGDIAGLAIVERERARQQAVEQQAAECPFAQARLRVDVTSRAGIGKARAPALGQAPRCRQRGIGIIAAADDDRRERQVCLGHRSEAGEAAVLDAVFHVGRRHQQGADHRQIGRVEPVGQAFVFRPPGHGKAAQAVRHEHDRTPGAFVRTLDGQGQLVDPGVAVRIAPQSQIDAMAIGKRLFPKGLPVIGARIVNPRNRQDDRIEGAGKGMFMGHTSSPNEEAGRSTRFTSRHEQEITQSWR
jgi:hypothetical protein